jgi:hypothetical protein
MEGLLGKGEERRFGPRFGFWLGLSGLLNVWARSEGGRRIPATNNQTSPCIHQDAGLFAVVKKRLF